MWRTFFLMLALTLGLSAPARAESQSQTDSPRVLVMGDSLMAMNRLLGGSVAQALSDALAVKVTDQSVIGARYFYRVPLLDAAGLQIGAQLAPGPWDYVVMNGGGNDLLFGCGCGRCTRMMNRLISPDGTAGAIPELVGRIRGLGAQVIYTGYLRTPGVLSPVESCGPLGDEMDRRLMLMAARDGGVRFVLLSDLVTQDGDRSYHGVDMVHPSVKGSKAIAARVAAQIRQ